MIRLIFVFILFLDLMVSLEAQRVIPLYDGAIPNSKNTPDLESIKYRGIDNRAFVNTSIPTLSIYRPSKPNSQAIIICPGGAYAYTAFDKEGTVIARELIKSGITAFVLKYRTPQDQANINKAIAPLQDAQQAIQYVRKNAEKYGVQPNQIGIMGFSAGGHLAASAATQVDCLGRDCPDNAKSVRPDFVALIYPVISFDESMTHMGSRINLIGEHPSIEEIVQWSNDKQVSSNSPPAFLVHAGDDQAVPVENSIAYYRACLKNNVPAELHIYPKGGHGFGLNNTTTSDKWIERFINWLDQLD